MRIHSIGPEIIILTAGSIVYTIKRAADENLTLWLYAEWESPKDLAEHLKSPYLKEHLKTLQKLDVVRSDFESSERS